jgi:hypothetical protein
MFANKGSSPVNSGGFYPIDESDYNLPSLINDSSNQYYTFTDIIFKKHLIEVKGDNYYIKLSPAAILSKGVDLGEYSNGDDTLRRKLFKNMRGVHAEGDILDNFSFSTSFYENQSRNPIYERSYYSKLGELYPQAGNVYTTQNAVMPGAGRTKPFKTDAFDYAFAVGYLSYAPFKNFKITAGNNTQFIGDGHRSILLSDNSFSAPYFRLAWKPMQKFKVTYYRARLMNLLRKPIGSSAENYYESKGYSVNYYSFFPNERISVSLFEGSLWNRGDSLRSKTSHPLYYNPVPFVSGLVLSGKNEVASLIGLNYSHQLLDKHRVYAQIAMNDFNINKVAFQFGYRGYNFFNINDFMLQIEYNYVAPHAYEVNNRRLNYAHYNLPLAHVKGNGFSEFLLRSNYEFKRVYAELTNIIYFTQEYNSESLLPIYDPLTLTSGETMFTNLEIGYRMNRKMNLCFYGRWTYRSTFDPLVQNTNVLEVGMSTSLLNHYRDF